MKKIEIPAKPDHADKKKRFLHDIVIVLGDDIESDYDVVEKDFPDDLPDSWTDPDDVKVKKNACRCGQILLGEIEPPQCPLYKTNCDPTRPQGACMVSEEGTCSIYYRHGK